MRQNVGDIEAKSGVSVAMSLFSKYLPCYLILVSVLMASWTCLVSKL